MTLFSRASTYKNKNFGLVKCGSNFVGRFSTLDTACAGTHRFRPVVELAVSGEKITHFFKIVKNNRHPARVLQD